MSHKISNIFNSPTCATSSRARSSGAWHIDDHIVHRPTYHLREVRLARLLVVILFLFAMSTKMGFGQCTYPCWSQLGSGVFNYYSFSSVSQPTPSSPYVFAFPYPPQTSGDYDTRSQCNFSNAAIDYYNGSTGPLTGQVFRNPSYLDVSVYATGWKGIATQASFTGSGSWNNGNTLVQSVFFHNDLCYFASDPSTSPAYSEFGFQRQVKGLASDNTLYFYVEVNANCNPSGACRQKGTGTYITDQQDNYALSIPSVTNSHGEANWLYEAWLTSSSQFEIVVLDPYSYSVKAGPYYYTVPSWFSTTASSMWSGGSAGNGYVTAGAVRNGALSYSIAPEMDVVGIWAAK